MNLRIIRRQFGQLAIATIAAIANLAAKTDAQQPNEVIFGVSLASSSNTDAANTAIDQIKNTPAIALISSDLATGQELSISNVAPLIVENVDTATETLNSVNRAVSTQRGERLTGFTVLSDGTFIVASVGRTTLGDISRLIFTDLKSFKARRALTVSGFKNLNTTVESLLATKKEQFLSVVSLNQGIPPFDLATIDLKTGKVTNGDELALPDLEANRRFSNLTQSPDGTIYATTIGRESVTSLVQLDLENKSIITGRGKIIRLSPLSFDNKPLKNDLLSLAFSPSGQLFALADPKYEGTNSLFTVDVKTGEMKQLRKFNVDKIAFARP